MRETFRKKALELGMSRLEVEEIWKSQFQYTISVMKENLMNEDAPEIRLTGLGTFFPNVPQMKIFKKKYNEKYRQESQTDGITEDLD